MHDQRVSADKKSGYTYKGKEITLSKKSGRPMRGLVAMGIKKGMYPEETKVQAVTIFAVTGDIKKTAELTKVPETTVKAWRRQEWFQETLNEIRDENNEKIDTKFNDIIEKSLSLIVDRLDNGDFHVHPKTGELMRKPIGIRDLSLVAAINIDKRQLLRGLPTNRTETVGSGNKLEQLKEAFIQLANTKREPRIIEAQTVEIIPNAVQEPSPEGVDVREQASNGETVAERNTEEQETPQKEI